MRLLVLDPRNGDRCAALFVIEPGARRPAHRFRFGYVPELRHDPAAGELLMVETELGHPGSGRTRYWLKRLHPDTLKLIGQVETPMRPMYAGFPGRSTRVVPTPSGRYVYVAGAGRPPRPPGCLSDPGPSLRSTTRNPGGGRALDRLLHGGV